MKMLRQGDESRLRTMREERRRSKQKYSSAKKIHITLYQGQVTRLLCRHI